MYQSAILAVQKPNVRIIKATKPLYSNTEREYRKLRVGAYGRVSTDHKEQTSSFEAQKTYFTDKIQSNPDWEFVGFFADEGISGTSVKKRAGFLAMIKNCMAGNIDLILTKSVSRFSRNLLDSIHYARQLKAKGVEIYFEQDGIKTFEPDSELQLAIMSLMAQDDIMRMSRNIKFGQIESIRNGKVRYQYSRWYGYEKGIDGKPQIVPQEALVVKQIFANYLAGDSLKKIADNLNKKNIPTKQGGRWYVSGVIRMLQDEKYCGNYLYQKTFKTDPLTKQAVKNTGQLPQYLIEKVHDGIITEETHKLVQEELKRRNDIKIDVGGKEKIARYSSTYALSERLYCANCKSSMRRKTWKNRDRTNRYVWVCSNRIKSKGQKCNAEVIDEYRLHDAIVKALNKFTQEKRAIDEMIERNMAEALANNLAGTNPLTLKNELTMLEQSFSDLIALSIKSQQPEMFEDKFKNLSDKIALKRKKYEKAEKLMESQKILNKKLQKVQQYIELTPSEITEYDDMLVRQTIKRIAVMDVNHIKITFIDDRKIIQTMEERK